MLASSPAVTKSRPKTVERILEVIHAAQTVAVVGHVRPDGDCIGSQLALALALKNEGKEVACWNEDRLPAKLAFLDPDRQMQRPKADRAFDCVIAVDAASFERLGEVGRHVASRGTLINIDHHASNTRYGDINWVSPRESATGELVFRLLKYAGWRIVPAVADSLFAAISTDTGSFQYATTGPSTFVVAGELVKRGANLGRICEEVYQSFPMARVRLLKHVYSHFRLTHDDQIAYFWLKTADFARTRADKSDAEGLIDHIRAIEPVVVACVFEEVEPELVRISLRSKSERVNVNQIASQFGGGGHPAAAGARIAGKPMAVQRRVIAAIKRALTDAQKACKPSTS
jgi:phosphoesterase RecJ-like protein